MSKPGLEVKDLVVGYADKGVCPPLSFSLKPAASISVLGPSGCGKSTLLSTILGLQPQISGTCSWDSGLEDRALLRQTPALLPWKSNLDNLLLPLELSGARGYSKDRRQLLLQVRQWAQRLGLDENKLKRYPHELSGGERQRLALGQALIRKVQVLLMDEPFAALDLLNRHRMQDLVVKSCLMGKLSLIIVTHDVSEAVLLGQQILVMGRSGHKLFENKLGLPDNPAILRDDPKFFAMTRTIVQALKELNEELPVKGAGHE